MMSKEDRFKIGDKWTHKKSGNIYKIVDVMPLKLNGIWTEAIVYEGEDFCVWSRPIDNFIEKFAEIENNN